MSLCRKFPRVFESRVVVAPVEAGGQAVASVAPIARLHVPSPALRATLRVYSSAVGDPAFGAASWTLRPLHRDQDGRAVSLPAIFTGRSLLASPYSDAWELGSGIRDIQAELAFTLGSAAAGVKAYVAVEIQPAGYMPVEYWEELYQECSLQALPSTGLRLSAG